MRVMVAMSGGVDSAVAADLLMRAGHEVVGVTMKLWGGSSDRGCCSVADVDDARMVALRLGIPHHVLNMSDEFGSAVVDPYVQAHVAGRTPNPCMECNRHIKFGALMSRADALGFDALATGHHARLDSHARLGREDPPRLRRGMDRSKDQSYVLAVVDPPVLGRVLLPVGDLTKEQVRARARELGLRVAAKPDSQEVCFVSSRQGRAEFIGKRAPLHPAQVVESGTGSVLGTVPSVELVTVGQRHGLGAAVGRPVYALEVDVERRRVTAGSREEMMTAYLEVDCWRPAGAGGRAGALAGKQVLVQASAHGRVTRGEIAEGEGGNGVALAAPVRRVAPGQPVVCYDLSDDAVIAWGVARSAALRPGKETVGHAGPVSAGADERPCRPGKEMSGSAGRNS